MAKGDRVLCTGTGDSSPHDLCWSVEKGMKLAPARLNSPTPTGVGNFISHRTHVTSYSGSYLATRMKSQHLNKGNTYQLPISGSKRPKRMLMASHGVVLVAADNASATTVTLMYPMKLEVLL